MEDVVRRKPNGLSAIEHGEDDVGRQEEGIASGQLTRAKPPTQGEVRTKTTGARTRRSYHARRRKEKVV